MLHAIRTETGGHFYIFPPEMHFSIDMANDFGYTS